MDNNFNKIVYLNERIKGSYKPETQDSQTSLSPIWNIQEDTKPRFESITPYKEETIYQTMNDGTKVSKYESFIPGINNEQRLAEQQSTSEKWINGASKFFAKTGTAVLGGTYGIVNDLIVGVKEGSLSAAYNSDFDKWLDDLNTKLDYKLPNYYTEQEKEAGFGGSIGSANFWANDFLGGLSFTAGAIVSEGIWAYATGGTSLLARGGAGALTRNLTNAELKTAGIFGKRIATQPMRNAVNAPLSLGSVVQATRANQTVKALDALRFTMTSAGYESAMEARQYMKNTEDEWLKNFENQNGRTPDGTEYQDFKNNLTNTANAVFTANMVLVGSSNMATFGKLAMGKTIKPELSNSWFSKNLLGVGFKEGTERGTLEAIQATTAQKAFSRVYGIGKHAVTEGLYEEGGQKVASETAKNFMLSGYDKNATRTSYGMQEALYEALSSTYGTKEGWKEVGLGMLIGAFGGGFSSVASGQGLFNDSAIERQNIEANVNNYNNFHVGMLINNQIANNKISRAIEKSDAANKKDDSTGEIQANRESMIAVLENLDSLGGVDYGIEQFQTAMNATPDADLAQQLGVSVEEAAQYKQIRISEFKELASDYEAYNNFSNSLLGDVKIAGMSNDDRIKLGRAITSNMVLGKHALKDSQDITNTIKRFIASDITTSNSAEQAIDTDFVLDQTEANKKKQYNILDRKSKYLAKTEQDLLRKTLDLQTISNKEDNTEKTRLLNDNAKKLLDVQQEKAEIYNQKQVIVDAINVKNLTGTNITIEMLDNQKENIGKLSESIQALKQVDPQKYAIVQKLIQEQSRAIRNVKGFNETTQTLMNPETRFTLLNGWLSSILKARDYKENEFEYFKSTLESYAENKAEIEIIVRGQKEDNEAYVSFKKGEVVENSYLEKLNSEIKKGNTLTIQQQEILNANSERAEELNVDTIEIEETVEKPKSQIDQKINDILNKNLYTLQYIGEEVLTAEEPTQEEINRYQELLYNNENTEEFQNLTKKLTDWTILEGSVDEYDSSIADLLRIRKALQDNVLRAETKVEYSNTDYDFLTAEINTADTPFLTNSSVVKSPDNALTFVSERDGIRKQNISFLSIEGFARFFPNSEIFSKTRTGLKEFKPSKKEGSKFVIIQEDKEIEVEVGTNSRLVVLENSLNNIPSTLHILSTGVSNQNILFEELANGELIPVKSDFITEDTKGNKVQAVPELVNSKKKGDVLELRVDKEDSYNAQLIQKYNSNPTDQALEELENSLNIYIYGQGSNEVLGQLSATTGNSAITPAFEKNKSIRKETVERMLFSPDRIVGTGQTATVNTVLLGSPNLQAQLDENGNAQPTTIPFTEKALENIVSTGYMQGDDVVYSKSVNDVNLTSVKGITKRNAQFKIPFVVIRYQDKNVAFPIKMNVTQISKSEDLSRIMNTEISADEKAVQVIRLMQGSGISPETYNINFANTDWQTSDELNNLSDALSELELYLSADELADKSFDKNQLLSSAEIAVDITNNPFSTGKLLINLGNVEYQSPVQKRSELQDNVVSLEAELSDEAIQINRQINEAAQIASNLDLTFPEDNTFIQAFSENAVISVGSENLPNISQQVNINILREAISESIPKKVLDIVGKDKIDSIKNKFEKIAELKELMNEAKIQANLRKEVQKVKEC